MYAYGGISGYFGGNVDDIMQRIVEIIYGIPNLVVVILMILVLTRDYVDYYSVSDYELD